MALTNPFLRGVVNGFLGSPNVKDYKHAAKTFNTNYFGNAPKFKWLFHVYFDLSTGLSVNQQQVLSQTVNHGLLVKNIDLPKFNISLAEMNQYNRKRLVQTKINYEPIRVVFHDDNANQIRHLWHAYYSYYYNDTNNPVSETSSGSPPDVEKAASILTKKNTYSADISNEQGYGYVGEYNNTAAGLWNGKAPFFRTIRIYGFNQHNFAEYQLINPVIESFAHDQYDYYSRDGTMEHQMTIRFENVKYYEGSFNGQNPGSLVKRFAEQGVYDTELSPINRPGNNKTITGPGGLVDAGLGIVNDLSNNPPNILGALQKSGRLARTFKNPQDILQTAKREVVGGVIGAIQNPASARNIFNFPTPGGQSNTVSQNVNNTRIATPNSEPVSVPPNDPISGP
jgi:hypothetical protein